MYSLSSYGGFLQAQKGDLLDPVITTQDAVVSARGEGCQ